MPCICMLLLHNCYWPSGLKLLPHLQTLVMVNLSAERKNLLFHKIYYKHTQNWAVIWHKQTSTVIISKAIRCLQWPTVCNELHICVCVCVCMCVCACVNTTNTDVRSLPFHCLNLSCFTSSLSLLNHSSLDSGGLMYGNCDSSPTNNTYVIIIIIIIIIVTPSVSHLRYTRTHT